MYRLKWYWAHTLVLIFLLGGCATQAAYKPSAEPQAVLTIRVPPGGVNSWFIHYRGRMIGAECSEFPREIIAILNNVSIFHGYADGGKRLTEVTTTINANGSPFRVATLFVASDLSQGWGGLTVHTRDSWPQISFVPVAGHHYFLSLSESSDRVGILSLGEGSAEQPVDSFTRLPPCWDERTGRPQKRFIENYYANHRNFYPQ